MRVSKFWFFGRLCVYVWRSCLCFSSFLVDHIVHKLCLNERFMFMHTIQKSGADPGNLSFSVCCPVCSCYPCCAFVCSCGVMWWFCLWDTEHQFCEHRPLLSFFRCTTSWIRHGCMMWTSSFSCCFFLVWWGILCRDLYIYCTGCKFSYIKFTFSCFGISFSANMLELIWELHCLAWRFGSLIKLMSCVTMLCILLWIYLKIPFIVDISIMQCQMSPLSSLENVMPSSCSACWDLKSMDVVLRSSHHAFLTLNN